MRTCKKWAQSPASLPFNIRFVFINSEYNIFLLKIELFACSETSELSVGSEGGRLTVVLGGRCQCFLVTDKLSKGSWMLTARRSVFEIHGNEETQQSFPSARGAWSGPPSRARYGPEVINHSSHGPRGQRTSQRRYGQRDPAHIHQKTTGCPPGTPVKNVSAHTQTQGRGAEDVTLPPWANADLDLISRTCWSFLATQTESESPPAPKKEPG